MKKVQFFALLLGISFLFFDLQYLIMSRLPGAYNEMCVMGAGLNLSNIIFAGVLSLMFGFFALGFLKLFREKNFFRKEGLLAGEAGAASGLGFILGLLTLFCPTCAFPALSLFGLSLGFGIFTDYNVTFKILSLIFMAMALYKLYPQLKRAYSDYSS